jgi:hypothetical protein
MPRARDVMIILMLLASELSSAVKEDRRQMGITVRAYISDAFFSPDDS